MRILSAALAVLSGFLLLSPAAMAGSGDVAMLKKCVAARAGGQSQAEVVAACNGMFGDCPDQTTVGISECIMGEAGAWDTLLNEWWTPMKARAQADGSWDSLLAAQRQWIKDRDAQCAEAYNSAGGGSIRVIWAAECQRDLTAQRAVAFYFSLHP